MLPHKQSTTFVVPPCWKCFLGEAGCAVHSGAWLTLSKIRVPILNVNMSKTFSARVIMLINVMVKICITLKSLLHKLGCTAPIGWLEYSTCLFKVLCSILLRCIFLLVKGIPTTSGLGYTVFTSERLLKSSSFSRYGMIIEWPLNGQFNDVDTDFLTSQIVRW